MLGCLVGWLVLGALPGIIFTQFYYGSQAYMHPEIVGMLARPAMMIGGFLGAIAAVGICFSYPLKD